MSSMMAGLNINDSIYIKLTPLGEKYLKKYYKKMGRDDHINKDIDGLTEFSLWEFANIFGPELYNGNTKLPVESTVYFNKWDFEFER